MTALICGHAEVRSAGIYGPQFGLCGTCESYRLRAVPAAACDPLTREECCDGTPCGDCTARVCSHCSQPLPGNARPNRFYCSAACRKTASERRRGVRPRGETVPPHGGSGSRYQHYGCRCDECRAAEAARRRRRHARGEVGPRGTHGLSGYRNAGCRCDICKAAASDDNRRAYLRRRATPLSPAEQATVDRFEAAPDPWEET